MKRGIPSSAMLVALASALVVMSGAGAAVAASPHAKVGWSVQTVPSPAGASNVALNGISCHTRELCIAVGGSSLGTLAEEWNGTAWSIQTTPSPASGDVLNSVSCVSASACEAVGSSGTGTLAEAWNGTTWTIQPTPTSSGASLASVSCTSRTQCVAAGSNNNGPIAEGWNGTRWARQPGLPPRHHSPRRTPVALGGVRCSSALSCTGVGYVYDVPGPPGPFMATATWNGTKWAWSGTSNAGLLSSISCSAKVCVAVGQAIPPKSPVPRSYPVSLINPGTTGETVVLPVNPSADDITQLNAVSCRLSVCEAVGTAGLPAFPLTLAERWNGTSWSLQSTPNPAGQDNQLAGIACTSPTACIAVGSASGAPLAEAYS